MKQLYIISFLLFLIGFYGCYDDEGNYDYTEVFEIRIDSMKASYTLGCVPNQCTGICSDIGYHRYYPGLGLSDDTGPWFI